MLRDIRHGIRVLLQAKGWTVVVVLSLALGIGANIALFGAVNGLLLRKLAVDEPGSLVRMKWNGRNEMATDTSDYGFSAMVGGQNVRATFSYPMFLHFQSANQTLTDIFASAPVSRVVAVIDGQAETASALLTSGSYYSALGVKARIGRLITPADDQHSAPAVALLSDRYWRSRFSADTGVVGKVVHINGVAVTIVGVVSPDFTGSQRATAQFQDFAFPLVLDAQIGPDPGRLQSPTYWWVQVMGRLKPGSTAEQVKGNFEGVFKGQARAGMAAHLASLSEDERKLAENQGRDEVPQLLVESGSTGIYEANTRDVRALAILSAVVALVLLLVCANVANLLLSRATGREKELSIRLSIGATRGRLIRQLLTESLLLASAGGVLGMLISYWGQAMLPPPFANAASPDWRVALFTAVITVVSGVIFGIAPALSATRINVGTTIKENSRSVVGSNTVLSRVLLVAQVSISLVLLVGAGLFLRTLDNLRRVDAGFDLNNLVFVRVNADVKQNDDDFKTRFFQRGIDELEALPGVRSATVSDPTLLSGTENGTALFALGRTYAQGRTGANDINRVTVAANYFETMGISLAAGRGFSERDAKDSPKVAVINEAAARKFFPNENPVGRRIGYSVDNPSEVEIVGVLRDVKYTSLREPSPPTLYVPYLQRGPARMVFTVRTAGDPSGMMNAIRQTVARLSPNVPIVTVETQLSQVEQRLAQEKVLAQAYTLFGGIAVFIAAIGLFGLMSYTVARRTREIGIRMAMGAQREEVLKLVLRESMLLVVAGISVGIVGALAAGRLIATQLFGLEPTDVTTIAAAVATMIAVASVAGYLPARRATRVDPMVALRYE